MTDMQIVTIIRPHAAVAMAAALASAAPASAFTYPACAQVKAATGGRASHKLALSQIAWGRHHEDLTAWSRLAPDWDGEEGVAPRSNVVENARQFITEAEQAGVPVPVSYIAGDGEVGYSWDTPRGFASVSFLPDGAIVGKVRTTGLPTLRIDEPFTNASRLNDLFPRIALIA